jgi:hypothetical protein
MRALVLVGMIYACAMPRLAAADDLANWLIGPVFGLRLDGPGGGTIGLEGGYGFGPERLNLGFEYRAQKAFYYAEVDPWYILGGTLGVGVDEDGKSSPVLGVWEGLPLTTGGSCSGWHNQVTIAGGYRYTGVHELYLTVKAGMMDGNVCFD